MSKTIFCMAPLQYSGIECMFVCVCASVCVCVCVCVYVRPHLDPNWLWLHFLRIFSQWEGVGAQTEQWDQRGKLISPLRDAVLSRVCGHRDTRKHARTHTHTHTHCEWCPLLLGVLASLMRCERGTEMEQVEEEKEVDQRNGAREEEM